MKRFFKMGRKIFLASAGFITLSAGLANTLYIAPTGSDSIGTGSFANPYQTISYGESMATPGTEVIVRGGIYYEHVKTHGSGTTGNYVWMHPYHGETAVIDGTGLPPSTDLVSLYANYVIFDGFEVRNSPDNGIAEWGANVQLINNKVHDNYNTGIYCGGTNCHDVLIQKNTVYRNILMNSVNPGSVNWGQGITIWADLTKNWNITVQSNDVYNNWGEGIGSVKTLGTVIANNTVHDNFSIEIYIDSSPNVTVSGNFTYWTGDTRFVDVIKHYGPIGLGTSIELSGGSLDGNIWINNLDVGSLEGFRYYPNQTGTGFAGLTNNQIANNTFVNETRYGIQIDPYPGQNIGNTLVNNIFYTSTSGVLVSTITSGSGVTVSNNGWYGNGAGIYSGTHDITANPQFLNPGSFVASDYQITGSSPCRAAGLSLGAVTVDFFGNPRPLGAAYTLGASEFISILQNFRISNGLALDGSQDLLIPSGDAVPNLLKYAFNMMGTGTGQASTLSIPNVQKVGVSGTAGLPGFSGTGPLTVTYIRRVAATSPGISYAVEFSSDLGSWAVNPSAIENVSPINSNFERVSVTDSIVTGNRFARLRVTEL